MKEKTTITFDSEILSELRKLAKSRNKKKPNVSEVVNEAAKVYLQQVNSENMDKVYAPIVERYLQDGLKSFENRFAALMAKNALDSSMSMLLLLESISKSKKISSGELYKSFRPMAVKHVKQREELLKMVTDTTKGDKEK